MKSSITEIIVNYIGPFICLVVMGFINFYLYFILMVIAFGLFDCGEDLKEWYEVRTAFIGAFVLFVLQLGITYLLRKRKPYLWVFALVTTASFLVMLYFGVCFANYGHYYQDFDATAWKASKYKPMGMTRTIYEDQRYIGKSKATILADLGQADRNMVAKLHYNTDQYSELVFEFKDDKVASYYVYCDD